MRVLYVVPRFPVGTHTFGLWQVSGAVHAGHEVRVLSGRKGNTDGYRLAKELGIDENIITYADWRQSPLWNWSTRRFSRPVRDAARRQWFGRILAERRKTYFCDVLDRAEIARSQLLHCHFLGPAVEVGVPLGSLLGVPVVVSAHSPVADFELEHLRYVQDGAGAVIVPSNAERRDWIRRTGSERKLVRVWNGAPPVAGHPESRTRGGSLRLVSVSRLSPEKRVGDLVSVVALLRGMGHRCLLDVYGEGPLRSDVETRRRWRRVAGVDRDPDLRCPMRQAGRERLEREFSPVLHMRNIEEVWARALSGVRSRR